MTSRATAYIPFDDLADRVKEKARLVAENLKMDKEIARAVGMLANPGFIGKAPAAKIEAEKQKLEKYRAMKAQILEQLARF